MTLVLRHLRSRALPALSEWFLFLPVWFTLSILIFGDKGPGPMIAALGMAAVVVMGAMMRTLVRTGKVWLFVIFIVICTVAAGVGWPGPLVERVVAAVLAGVFFTRATMYGSRSWEQLIQVRVTWVCLILYFVGYFFYSKAPLLQPYHDTFTICAIIALAIVLILTNTMHVTATSLAQDQDDKATVRPILRTNRLYLIVIFVVIIGISLYDQIWTYLSDSLSRLLSMIRLPSFGSDNPVQEQDIPGNLILEGSPDSNPVRNNSFVEQLVKWVTIVFILAILVAAIFYAIKGGRILYRRLLALLGKKVEEQEDTGYVDEKESLLDKAAKDNRRLFKEMWRRLTEREPKWNDLTNNRERARFLFRKWLQRMRNSGLELKQQLTPREIFQEASLHELQGAGQSGKRSDGRAMQRDAASSRSHEASLIAYHKARYAPPDTEPSTEEIEQMRIELQDNLK